LKQKKKGSPKKQEKTPVALYIGIFIVAVLVVLVLIQVGRPKIENVGEVGPILPDGVSSGTTDNGMPFAGSLDSPVQVVLYEDYGCHNCKSFYENFEAELIDQYVANGNISLLIHPIAFVNAQSLPGAEAAFCALDQGKFWEYRHLLFLNQGIVPFTRDNLVTFAQTVGMDQAAFSSCYDQGKYVSLVRNNTSEAQNAGVRGTPSFLIGSQMIEGVLAFDSSDPEQPGLKQLIDPLLQ
jgi:protein-disulfide isomerase